MHVDTLIVGAGVAGLAAARELTKHGARTLIAEARDRLGGRVLTWRDPLQGAPVELGAEFVHGRPPELMDLAAHLRLTLVQVMGDHLCYRDRRLCDCGDWFDSVDSVMEQMDKLAGQPDRSFATFIAAAPCDGETKLRATAFVEGFNAADADLISVHALIKQNEAEEKTGGAESMYRVVNGYDTVVRGLAAALGPEVAFSLNTVVESIEWKRGEVRIGVRGRNEPMLASKCIVTLPAGVLKAGWVRFAPPPPVFGEPLEAVEMGNVTRIVLRFRPCFWHSRRELARASFLHAAGEPIPTWWTQFPLQTPVLVGWAGGRQADPLLNCSDDQIFGLALDTLAKMLTSTRAEIAGHLEAWRLHRWRDDPFAGGAYSYVRTGGLPAAARLAEPVEDTLFFAGEHTDVTANWGTVHGAIASGIRAARQVIGA